MRRRDFLKATGAAAAHGMAAGAANTVAIVLDPADPVSASAPAQWAAGELKRELEANGVRAVLHDSLAQAGRGDFRVLAAGAHNQLAKGILESARITMPAGPESLVLASGSSGNAPVLLAAGADPRGLVYALLELADRAAHSAGDAVAALQVRKPVGETPANSVRSIARYFESDIEDKSWYNDKSFWGPYLSMLAANRFNRFSMSFGLGYNFPRRVSDVYFYFTYPFLMPVHGYSVRAVPLADAERDRNLEMLKFIGEETVKRGLDFQLGLWTHAYEWIDSPDANYRIEGLTKENHASYCRDALYSLLEALPMTSGVTFRIHGESGVPEGSYDFWKTLFEGIVRTGRRIEIDMHAKGMDQKMIDIALATGMPVKVSPKYWGEHMGLPYHQAAIRDLEMPRNRQRVDGTFALSAGSRSFLRYGYGDLLREDRKYGVLHRIWPGTQRFLLWGDPAYAAGFGRLANFCGSSGVEMCEPLSFKGRMGSGRPGGRSAYADTSLNPKYDWQKFAYFYRVWGRLGYDPDSEPEVWRRTLHKDFGDAAGAAEVALANASRVLPLVTTSHGASGSNNTYWPEMYTNMPIVDPARKHPYGDTPSPKKFGTVSPFDPELFSTADDFAAGLIKGDPDAKYSPLDVAQWLEDFSVSAANQWTQAEKRVRVRNAEFRRWAADVAIESGLGRFFAWKLRSAVLWAIYDRAGDEAALAEALKAYRMARDAWSGLSQAGRNIYVSDITYGMTPHLRGNWLDRLPAIDADIADMEKHLHTAPRNTAANSDQVRRAVAQVLTTRRRQDVTARHIPPSRFRPGDAVHLELALEDAGSRAVKLHFRRVNQAERWQSTDMRLSDRQYRGEIAADYTQSPYPLQYYFEIREVSQTPSAGYPRIYPGFNETLSNLPYFVVRQV